MSICISGYENYPSAKSSHKVKMKLKNELNEFTYVYQFACVKDLCNKKYMCMCPTSNCTREYVVHRYCVCVHNHYLVGWKWLFKWNCSKYS